MKLLLEVSPTTYLDPWGSEKWIILSQPVLSQMYEKTAETYLNSRSRRFASHFSLLHMLIMRTSASGGEARFIRKRGCQCWQKGTEIPRLDETLRSSLFCSIAIPLLSRAGTQPCPGLSMWVSFRRGRVRRRTDPLGGPAWPCTCRLLSHPPHCREASLWACDLCAAALAEP